MTIDTGGLIVKSLGHFGAAAGYYDCSATLRVSSHGVPPGGGR